MPEAWSCRWRRSWWRSQLREACAGFAIAALHSAEGLQKAAVEALIRRKSQETAADAMADAEWSVAEGEVRVQTEISKTMLPMVINPEAEKIDRDALRDAGAGR